jgi:anti-sigma factor RsiW
MKCEEAFNLLDPFVHQELGEKQSSVLVAHLEGCTLCRSETESLIRLRELIKSALHEEARLADPGDIAARVLRRLPDSTPKGFGWMFPVWACAVALFVIGIGLIASRQAVVQNWFTKKGGDAVVEELQSSGTMLALWKDSESATPVIWLFDEAGKTGDEVSP